MAEFFDTIVAPITGRGKAAVALVRLSGPEASRIAGRVFSGDLSEARRVVYGRFNSGDDGLGWRLEAGKSYTGEEVVELSLHGSPASVGLLVAECVRQGARAARPGEFTERAFLNGRLDLTQAEAVRDTVEAVTESQLRLAELHRNGALWRQVSALRSEIVSCIAAVEAAVDFSEETGPLDRQALAGRVRGALEGVRSLLDTARPGRIMREGLRVAIVGPPNAGKSSLMNALLGAERSIVTAAPGTTRDYVEESAEIGGIPCVLVDTAGLREAPDEAESIGVRRAAEQAAGADLVLFVFDGLAGWTENEQAAIDLLTRPAIVIANKADLYTLPPATGIPVSARHGDGLAELGRLIAEWAGLDDLAGAPLVNSRHEPLLEDASSSLGSVLDALNGDLPDDLLAVGLQGAAACLGQITGEAAGHDIIESIFREFCVGK